MSQGELNDQPSFDKFWAHGQANYGKWANIYDVAQLQVLTST